MVFDARNKINLISAKMIIWIETNFCVPYFGRRIHKDDRVINFSESALVQNSDKTALAGIFLLVYPTTVNL